MITADKVLSESQLNRFLKRLRSEKDRSMATIQVSVKPLPKEVRVVMDYFLFTLIAYTGLRISEALSLKWSDIHDDFLIVQHGVSKSGKKGSVYFGTKTNALLNELKKSKSLIAKDETRPRNILFSERKRRLENLP